MNKTENLIIVLINLFVIKLSFFKGYRDSISFDFLTLLQIALVFLIIGIVLFQNKFNFKPLFWNNSFYLLFYAYLLGIISYFWSALPAFSAYIAFQNTVFLVAIFFVFSSRKNFQNLELLFIKLSFAFIIYTALGDLLRARSVYILLNWSNLQAAGIAGMLLCYSVAEILNYNYIKREITRKKYLIKVAVISFVILINCTSSGSNLSAIAGLFAIILLSGNIYLNAIVLFFLSIVFIDPEIINQIVTIIFPGKEVHEIKSFGSRMHIWEPIWELFKQRPILGWGYGAAERIGERYQIDPHNSFIGFLGGLGVVGATFFILFIFNLLKKIFENTFLKGYWGLFSATICLVVNSNTFGFLSSGISLLTIAFFMLCALSYYYKYLNIAEYGAHK